MGSVADVVVDVETHVAVQYAVTRSRLLPTISSNEIMVGRAQVVSVDSERMTVDDATIGDQASAVNLTAEAEGAAVRASGTSAMEG